MRVFCEFLHRYLAPFMAGASMAATTVVGDTPSIVLAVAVAVVFGLVSLPAGGRMIRRVAGLEEPL